jgi:hypothetical protein
MASSLRCQRFQHLAPRIPFDRHLYSIRALRNRPVAFCRFAREFVSYLVSVRDLSTRDSFSHFNSSGTYLMCAFTLFANIWQAAYSVQQFRSRRPVSRELEVLLSNQAREKQRSRCAFAPHYDRTSCFQGESFTHHVSLDLSSVV